MVLTCSTITIAVSDAWKQIGPISFSSFRIKPTGLAPDVSASLCLGTYDFTDATDGSKTTVEYTFGYKKNNDGKVRIYLHHSSVPYSAPKASTGDVTEAEVLACQSAWSAAIKQISKVYMEDGDFVATAGDAASELYGYEYSNVLFKPTKAVEERFRPSGESAMSYSAMFTLILYATS